MNARSVKFCRTVLLCMLGLAPVQSFSQNSFQDRYIERRVALEDGLPCNFVDDVCTDRFGFLWIATSGGGLCRFDGYELLTLNTATDPPLKSNFIRNLLCDNFDRLWIGSEGGLDVLDLRTHVKMDLGLDIPEDTLCSYLTKDATGAIWTKFGTTLYRFTFAADGSVAHAAIFKDDRLSPANFVFKDVDADGTLSGALTGSWSFDEAKQFLTLKTATRTVVVAVAKEVDWEANPRVETVVYAGTEKNLNATWWGKKVK